jgi:hypothetical protein
MSGDLRSKALGYLRDGKVTVVRADPHEERSRAVLVWACVQGFHGCHKVALENWRWRCVLAPYPDGRPQQERPECRLAECAHIAAVQMVTGHPSDADKPVPAQRGRRVA